MTRSSAEPFRGLLVEAFSALDMPLPTAVRNTSERRASPRDETRPDRRRPRRVTDDQTLADTRAPWALRESGLPPELFLEDDDGLSRGEETRPVDLQMLARVFDKSPPGMPVSIGAHTGVYRFHVDATLEPLEAFAPDASTTTRGHPLVVDNVHHAITRQGADDVSTGVESRSRASTEAQSQGDVSTVDDDRIVSPHEKTRVKASKRKVPGVRVTSVDVAVAPAVVVRPALQSKSDSQVSFKASTAGVGSRARTPRGAPSTTTPASLDSANERARPVALSKPTAPLPVEFPPSFIDSATRDLRANRLYDRAINCLSHGRREDALAEISNAMALMPDDPRIRTLFEDLSDLIDIPLVRGTVAR